MINQNQLNTFVRTANTFFLPDPKDWQRSVSEIDSFLNIDGEQILLTLEDVRIIVHSLDSKVITFDMIEKWARTIIFTGCADYDPSHKEEISQIIFLIDQFDILTDEKKKECFEKKIIPILKG